jgi:hypothetical protein
MRCWEGACRTFGGGGRENPVTNWTKIVAVTTLLVAFTVISAVARVLGGDVDDVTAAFLWRLYLAVGNGLLVIVVLRWRRCVQRTAIAR